MSDKLYTPSNPNAQQGVHNVLKYLSDITYEKIITGQHTQTMAQEELHLIEEITGKQPALLGFELLSYSPNINYSDTDDECMTEVTENYGTLKRAWEWAEQKGLITMCWHWFSPLYGRSKSFFSENTDFDASKAVIDGTPENKALLSDMDTMAGILRPFCDKGVPILWRPFHEGDGDWFWWGAKGSDAYKKLWKYLYNELTNTYGCNNLIWVYNGQSADWYPGDEYVDIVGEDIYPGNHVYDPQVSKFKEATGYGSKTKITALTENGCIFDIDSAVSINALWCWFMTWGSEFTVNGSNYSEKYTEKSVIKKMYASKYSLTLGTLPKIY